MTPSRAKEVLESTNGCKTRLNPMLSNSFHGSRFARGINYSPIHAQVPELTPGELLHACRNNIECGVNVAVVSTAALGAIPLPNIKPQFIELMTATTTGLARWKPTINGNQSPAVPLAFVLQLPPNLSPARVGNVPCKSGVLNHIFDGQVFDANHIEVSYQSGGQLVRLVLALIPDFRVSLGDSQALLLSPLAALLFTAQGALLLAKVSESGVVLLGVFDLGSIAQCGQVSQPQVNPDNLIGDRQNINLNGCAERDVIPAVRLSLQSDHAGACNLWQVLCEFYHTKLWQANNTLNPFHRDFLKPQGIGLPSLFKSWVTWVLASLNAAEEVTKRLILVIESLNQACRWRDSKPRIAASLFELSESSGNINACNGFFSALVGFISGCKRPIPNPTSATEPMVQHTNLCSAWVDTNFIVSLYGRHTHILQQKDPESVVNA